MKKPIKTILSTPSSAFVPVLLGCPDCQETRIDKLEINPESSPLTAECACGTVYGIEDELLNRLIDTTGKEDN
jgi:hypothetical protein